MDDYYLLFYVILLSRIFNLAVTNTPLNGTLAEVIYHYHDHKLPPFSVRMFVFVTTSYFLYCHLWSQVTSFQCLLWSQVTSFIVICDHKLLPLLNLWSQITSSIKSVITSYFLSMFVICDHKLLPLLSFVITSYFLSVFVVITGYSLYYHLWSQVTSSINSVITNYFLSVFVICDHKVLPLLLFVITSYFIYYLWPQVASSIVICDHKLLIFSVMVFRFVTTSYFL